MRPQSPWTPDVLWLGTLSLPLSFSLCFFLLHSTWEAWMCRDPTAGWRSWLPCAESGWVAPVCDPGVKLPCCLPFQPELRVRMDGCTLPGPRVHIPTPLGDYCDLCNRGQRLEWVWCLSSAILPVSCLKALPSAMCVWWLARQWRRMVKGWTNFSELLVVDQNIFKR